MARASYDHLKIEKEAQAKWAESGIYTTDLSDESKEPYYLLIEFPYPSGDLHIGHWYAYAVTDIYARYLRMKEKNVLFPIGFDAFGLPAENAAIKRGLDPKEWTNANMDHMRTQLRSLGASFDWSKEVVTCDPAYYKWTQWLFLKLFEQGLAERKEAAVKWCPKDQTVLANEQVIDGHCERCGTEVVEKRLTQWFLKITDYAERLLTDLEPLPWREEIKEAQRAWIGKSEGAKLWFPIANTGEKIEVFTTRPDTVFGATYVVLAPEHPLVEVLLPKVANAEAAREYVAQTAKKTERERSENKEKIGVCLDGVRAINPATQEEIPVYIADYVLASYGTGAVMAVPAHDERDYEFAKAMNLPMQQVIVPCKNDPENPPQEGLKEVRRNTVVVHLRDTETGKFALLNWHGSLEGITTAIMGGIESDQTPEDAARAEILEEAGLGGVRIERTHPWITAAKYHASHKNENRHADCRVLLAEVDGLSSQLPVDAREKAQHSLIWVEKEEVLSRITPIHQKQMWQLLWKDEALTNDGYLINSGTFNSRDNQEAVGDIVEAVGGERATHYRMRDWLVSRQRYWGCPIPIVYDPEGKPHAVPTEHLPWTLPTDVDFAPQGEKSPLATSKELKERVISIFGKGWTPEYDTFDTFVDSSWYYTRYLDSKNEDAFSDPALMKKWLPVDRYAGGAEHTTMHLLYSRFLYKALYDMALVPNAEPFGERFNRGLILGPDGAKMSKSKGNVVNPDEFVAKYGADAVRSYLAFIGPYNEPGNYPWNLEGVESMRRFLDRIAALSEQVKDIEVSESLTRAVMKAAQKVGEDADRFKFNTALSTIMIVLKDFEALEAVPKAAYADLLRLIAPFAPHLAEHLYEAQGGTESIHISSWPHIDTELLVEDTKTVVVQVSGKRKGELKLAINASEKKAVEAAIQLPIVRSALNGLAPARVVYVPGKVVNLIPA